MPLLGSAIRTWSKHPTFDLAAGAVLALGYRLARDAGLPALVVQTSQGRAQIYQGALAYAGAVLAFVLVPAAIVIALTPGTRLTAILRWHDGDFRRATVFGASVALATLGTGVLSLAVDAGAEENRLVRYAVLALLTALTLAAFRMVDLFSLLLKNIGRDRDAGGLSHGVEPLAKLPQPGEGARVEVLR